jgi:cytochrome c oxidase subunit 2
MMISQDVIHSFFIPAFRIKQDVLPGRYTQQWFQATTPGEYHLFCTEYCGAEHSGMIGRVVVMEPEEYDAWLAGRPADVAPAQAGERLFTAQACITCHGVRGPSLAGVAGSQRQLADGRTVTADDNYLRESILYPHTKIVAGYPPIMPSYAGTLSEDQVRDLVAYIKTLSDAATTPVSAPAQPPAGR